MALCTTVPQHPAAVSYHTPSSGPSLRPPVTAVTAVAAAYRTTPQPRIYAPPSPPSKCLSPQPHPIPPRAVLRPSFHSQAVAGSRTVE
ncbi:uncharacterized protein LAJ45_10147 [Morchella importuna]|uniref:uncharacterized protein n=1 Tax=Morchella importuna TaxID=1174673 RepID=UPI001E8DEC84|nr:uncharacterized protein LAJ45_10147 [Morchella importuna]KAH8145823.1 hypothetical protein LAJ45_10147 [Morchella importuna]